MLKIGIVGLPNVGKSTLFQALTKKAVNIASYPFTTIDPNVGVVAVPDQRLEKIVSMLKPKEYHPAVIEFVDIAGLVKGAHQGEGLGNQFLSHIFNVDAILFLLRGFIDKNVPSAIGEINPQMELQILKEELAKKDEEITERVKKDKKIEQPKLSQKPSIVSCNIKVNGENKLWNGCQLNFDAKLELEASELSESEIKELGLEPKLPELIRLAYKTLGLITFYTIKGGQEIRAWPLKHRMLIPQAGGVVHSDFEQKFIRAEVIQWSKLLEAGSWHQAREKGWLKTVGHDYIVQDGDVIEFKI